MLAGIVGAVAAVLLAGAKVGFGRRHIPLQRSYLFLVILGSSVGLAALSFITGAYETGGPLCELGG